MLHSAHIMHVTTVKCAFLSTIKLFFCYILDETEILNWLCTVLVNHLDCLFISYFYFLHFEIIVYNKWKYLLFLIYLYIKIRCIYKSSLFIYKGKNNN